jgi:hypothetical protein
MLEYCKMTMENDSHINESVRNTINNVEFIKRRAKEYERQKRI